jgi:hypothetical protein
MLFRLPSSQPDPVITAPAAAPMQATPLNEPTPPSATIDIRSRDGARTRDREGR